MNSIQENQTLLGTLKKLYSKIMTLYMSARSGANGRQGNTGGTLDMAYTLSECIDKLAADTVVKPSGTSAPHLLSAEQAGNGGHGHASAPPEPSSGTGAGALSVHFRNAHIHSALFCDVGEKLVRSTWEHIDASIRTAREGDVKTAHLHAELANSAFKEARRYLTEPAYASFSQDVVQTLEEIKGLA